MGTEAVCGYSPLLNGREGNPWKEENSEGGRLLPAPGGTSGVVICGRGPNGECGEALAQLDSGLNAKSCWKFC